MIIRFATLLLLGSASLPLLAAENHTAPDGEDCPPAMVDEREAPGASAPQDGDVDAASNDKGSRSSGGGDADNSVRGPRMHNLLPGMFR